MIKYKNVYGSKEASQPLIVGVDTVYVHTNVRPFIDENRPEIKDMYVYDEIQYDKDEYIKLMSEKDDNLVKENETLNTRVTSTEDMILEMSSVVYA